MLYKHITSNAIRHGKNHESIALRQLEATYDVVVKECGLFVDRKRPFLGATPDGLVGDDTLVEIKCPYAARDLTPLEGVRSKKITYCAETSNGAVRLKSTSNYWYQIQGQLNICDRENVCLLSGQETVSTLRQ
ncbi:hypothetical protein HPB48_001608 [Haemaphysalis longicornis]|uniref:YqaJ viral recombinase domain-containing protein n=1 Tax=Haemaphysalis longicornis TaxID=44386 RepID=A0A9J6FBQ5_HAELO|nr:hypothetical protein HPB48_001608 [Haemaphysalis longicornis]